MFEFPHEGIDIEIVKFFNQFCGKSQFADTLGLIFLSVDALRTAILVSIIVGIWSYGQTKNDIVSKKKAISVLFIIFVSLSTIEILNAIIDSPRPIVTYESVINNPIATKNTKALWVDGWARNSKHGSFPSDTVALLAAMAFGIFSWNQSIGVIAILFVIFAGILPRLYFGLHYPSDMIIGSLISLMSYLAVNKVKFFDLISNKFIETEKKSPFLFGTIGFYISYIIADKFILIRKLPLWIKAMLGN